MSDTYEICPHCECEVLLKDAKLKTRQKCPECGSFILPCSLCKEKGMIGGCRECQKRTDWEHYLKYLVLWAKEHSEPECHGMSPACFDEFCDNDDDEYYDSVSMSEIIYGMKEI